MSHELEIIEGRALFLGREPAWHKLGMVVGDNFGWDEIATQLPEMASPVIRKAVFVDGELFDPIPNLAANVRVYDNKFVGMGSDRYEVFQQFEAWELGKVLADLGEMPCVSACIIRDGHQFAFTFDAGTFDVGGEQFHGHISVVGSHDGSMPVQVIYSLTVIVCANTMAVALDGATHRFVLRHTKNIREREALLREALGKGATYFAAHAAQVEAAQAVHVGAAQFREWVQVLFPTEGLAKGRSLTMRNDAQVAVGQLFNGALTDGHKDTGWAFVQAVNTWEQWEQTVKGVRGRDIADVRAERQFDAMVRGSQPLTDAAYELVLA